MQLGIDGERAELIVRELRDDEQTPGATCEVMFRVADVDVVLEAARVGGADADDGAGTGRTESARPASSTRSATGGC